jgi:AcrR family transcriptional regulator
VLVAEPRVGRPPRRDVHGTATRERLLAAAVHSCVEHGFDGATLNDIAARADVSAPAIYNHFASKVQLMVAAAQSLLADLRPVPGRIPSAKALVRAYLADDFASTRRFLVELHLASHRYPELADLLGAWHTEQAALSSGSGAPARPVQVATLFTFLLGLCHIESLSALGVAADEVRLQAEAMVSVLFPKEEIP